jgi:hypothetical protein
MPITGVERTPPERDVASPVRACRAWLDFFVEGEESCERVPAVAQPEGRSAACISFLARPGLAPPAKFIPPLLHPTERKKRRSPGTPVSRLLLEGRHLLVGRNFAFAAGAGLLWFRLDCCDCTATPCRYAAPVRFSNLTRRLHAGLISLPPLCGWVIVLPGSTEFPSARLLKLRRKACRRSAACISFLARPGACAPG